MATKGWIDEVAQSDCDGECEEVPMQHDDWIDFSRRWLAERRRRGADANYVHLYLAMKRAGMPDSGSNRRFSIRCLNSVLIGEAQSQPV